MDRAGRRYRGPEGETVIVPTTDGRVLAFAAAGCGAGSCEPRWELDLGTGAEVAAPVIAGDVLYVASGGDVQAFDLDDCAGEGCSPLWTGPGDSSPVVSGGQLYTWSGSALVAYGLNYPLE